MRKTICVLLVAAASASAAAKTKKTSAPPLDIYVSEAEQRGMSTDSRPPGSVWQPGAIFSDLARDLRASNVDDLVTIVVAESASAVSKGSTKTSRQSSAKYAVGAVLKKTSPAGPLANMLDGGGSQSLSGEGTTVRENTLTTTLSARVVNVLPNGYLVLDGTKTVVVNSETQIVNVRGVARPSDISSTNSIQSDRLAQLEVRINGKGVVGDAIRRPFFLYRILLGLLPF